MKGLGIATVYQIAYIELQMFVSYHHLTENRTQISPGRHVRLYSEKNYPKKYCTIIYEELFYHTKFQD